MTKERLRNYRKAKQEIKQLKNRIRELQEEAYSIKATQFGNGRPSGNKSSSAVESAVVRCMELEAAYNTKLNYLLGETLAIERAIEKLADSTESQLLRARYIQGLKWEEVCTVIGYSWSQMHRIHARALVHIRLFEEPRSSDANQ